MGQAVIEDKSLGKHLGISRFPFILTKVKASKLKNVVERAKQNPNLLVVDYTRNMLETRTDDELVKSISSKDSESLEYLGVVIYGNAKNVDEITGKFQLYN